MNPAIIEAVNVEKYFDQHHVLKGISLSVARGEVVVIIGPSGSGKSTFLRCCNGLEVAQQGSIRLCGQHLLQNGKMLAEPDLNLLRRQAGMVFQSFNLFPHLSILDNVAIGPHKILKQGRAFAQQLAMQLLEKVGLAHKAQAMPASLSGGQKQRVAIARALALQPEVMLFDEPTSALDPELTSEVLQVMKQLAQDGMTMIIVTHEMNFAREVADRLVVMEDGMIVEQGTTQQLFSAPQHPRTRALLQHVRVAAGENHEY
ncbi:amino acid ABC transporter ATP-binding protein [Pantoea cypripedii]